MNRFSFPSRALVAVVTGVALTIAGTAVAVALRAGTPTAPAPVGATAATGSPPAAAPRPPVAPPAGPLPATAATGGPPSPPPTAAPTVPAMASVGPLAPLLDPILVNTASCLDVRDTSGHVLYRHDAGTALAPASTQKLLVAAAALDVLGPGYRFVTSVVASRRPVAGEVDRLWLVGGGDPVLASPEFTSFLTLLPVTAGHPVTTQLVALVNQLAAAGVRAVPGGIHGDDSRYDRTRFLGTWPAIDAEEADVAPLGALEVDDGLDRWRPAVDTADPSGHAAGVLARLGQEAGIAAGQGDDATAPAGSVVLAAVQSPPLADIVTQMLRDSDNTTAEMLTRELDRVSGGTGATAGGVGVLMREAAKLGLPTTGLRLVDGSGLSPQDRASCATLLAALDLSSQPRFAAMGLLSVAGRFGTLVNRFRGTPAVGHLEAKTGNISGVIGLVGRLDVGPPLSFAFLLNGPFPYSVGAGYEDRVVAALAGVH